MTYFIEDATYQLNESDLVLVNRSKLIEAIKSNKFISGLRKLIRKNPGSNHAQDRIAAKFSEIYIIYRHVYISGDKDRFPNKSRPGGFSHNKCFRNLLETISKSNFGNRVHIIVFYNGTKEQFESDEFAKIIDCFEITVSIQLVDANSALESALIMLREVKNLKIEMNDILYIMENDYIHHEHWLNEVFELFESNVKFDYLSLYDHPDRYKHPSLYNDASLSVTSHRHWTTAPSTCGTFLLKYETFIRDFRHLYTYKPDHVVFTKLTKRLKRVLLTPIPGLAEHSMSEHLDPIQNFREYFNKDY